MTRLALPILIAVGLAACQSSPKDRDSGDSAEHADHETNSEVHWGYEGETGPEHWGDLTPEFCDCRDGKRQSPIDLAGATEITDAGLERVAGIAVLTREQRARVMDLVDNGHTIQITNDVPMAIDLDEVHYELVQYHFHAPSEHTIDGRHSPLEAHFVHKSAGGKLAVIGALLEVGAHDPLWDPVLAALPSGPDDPRHLEDLELDVEKFRPLPDRYYRYEGSLTTPPCSESVMWLVITEKRELSAEQMKTIVSHLHKNNRPVQPRGDRELLLVSGD